MVLIKPYLKSKQMVLNYQTIFKANNGFELLNHVSSKQASKQMVLNCKTIFQRASKQASKENIFENRPN